MNSKNQETDLWAKGEGRDLWAIGTNWRKDNSNGSPKEGINCIIKLKSEHAYVTWGQVS